MVGKEPGVKWSDQTEKRPSGLKCARCVPMRAFHFVRRVLSIGNLWTEIPANISENYCILAQHNVRHAFTRYISRAFLHLIKPVIRKFKTSCHRISKESVITHDASLVFITIRSPKIWHVKMNLILNKSLNNGTLSCFKRSLAPCKTRGMKIQKFLLRNHQKNWLSHMTHPSSELT